MKFLFVSLFMLSNVGFAADSVGVQNRLFAVLHQVYVSQVDADFCASTDRDCMINVNKLTCLRYGGCQVTFEKEDGSLAEVKVTNHLSLFLITRSAGAYGIGSIERFGPRYRPNYRTTAPFSCVGQGDFSAATCQ